MYEKFEWEDRYDLNVKGMDAEHKILIQKMNQLLSVCREKDPNTMDVFTDFSNYVKKHFLSEEEYMEKIGYTDISNHKIIHKNLLEKVDSFKNDLATNGNLSGEFFKFLKFWLSSHICGIDMKYSKFVNK